MEYIEQKDIHKDMANTTLSINTWIIADMCTHMLLCSQTVDCGTNESPHKDKNKE